MLCEKKGLTETIAVIALDTKDAGRKAQIINLKMHGASKAVFYLIRREHNDYL